MSFKTLLNDLFLSPMTALRCVHQNKKLCNIDKKNFFHKVDDGHTCESQVSLKGKYLPN